MASRGIGFLMAEIPELNGVRHEIDEADHDFLIEFASFLKRRRGLVDEVTRVKIEHDLAAHQPERYAELLAERQAWGEELGIDPQLVQCVWDAIHEDSMRQQNEKLL
jgi:chorismate mutase